MFKYFLAFALSSFIFSSTSFAKNRYENKEFTIDALVGKSSSVTNIQPLMMFLAPQGGFAPNVNVQIQNYPDSLKAYAELSLRQFKALKMKVVKSKITKKFALFEYTGNMKGNDFHFYARAFKKGKKIYLVTGTALVSQWANAKKKIVSTVDSFKLK